MDKEFMPQWRESKFPGGYSHACELETSLYLYLDGENVRKDKVKSGVISYNESVDRRIYGRWHNQQRPAW